MNSALKWYCKKKSTHFQTFETLALNKRKVRYLTKINAELSQINNLGDYVNIIKEYERIFEVYEHLKLEQQKTFTTIKKIKINPYKPLLKMKLSSLSRLNSKRFQQLIFAFKKMLFYSFQKSTDSNILTTWGLQIVNVYNRCNTVVNKLLSNELNFNICSNTYPNLLLPQRNLDFGVVLQLFSHRRIEQKILDILLSILNIDEFHEFNNEMGSSASSLEVLKILTQNIEGESDLLKYSTIDSIENGLCSAINSSRTPFNCNLKNRKSCGEDYMSNFLSKERLYIKNLISECERIAPTIFDEKQNQSEQFNYDIYLKAGLKTLWTYISTILDHVILWWIETPMSCYSLSYLDCVSNWILSDDFIEIQGPVHSSLKALCEILTIFVSNNVWDQIFRITLVTSSNTNIGMEDHRTNLVSGC